jgi:hypothetical protein
VTEAQQSYLEWTSDIDDDKNEMVCSNKKNVLVRTLYKAGEVLGFRMSPS